MVIDTFRYYSAAPERLLGETIPVAGGEAFTVREPLGVVGLIVPWNFPLTIASWKLAPALAAGNTAILKPAELTPLSAVRFAALATEAGLPDGVFQVVTGSGRVVGARLVEHPDVAKIAFTGSTEVGSAIAATAARTIKRVTLELGGKSANVIFADADLDQGDRDANSNRDHGRDQGQTNPKRSSQPDIHRHLIVYGSGGDKTKTPTTTRSHDRGYQSQEL